MAEGARRGDQAVGVTGVVHKPSEAETALRLLASRLRALSGLPPDAGEQHLRPHAIVHLQHSIIT